MSEELTEGTGTAEGQAEEGTQDGTTQPALEGGEGQPEEGQAEGTTETGTQEAPADTFFDPNDIKDKPELVAAYKQMQRAFSKRMDGLKEHRQKVEAYDAFAADPLANIQRVASQMGYQLTRAQAEAVKNDQEKTFEPQTWDDVIDRSTEAAEQRMMERFAPLLKQHQELKKSTIEQKLTEIDPTWQQYEDKMQTTLQQHPTLHQDPAMLYRMSVPPEVLESQATQKALKRLEAKAQSSQVSTSSTTNKSPGAVLPDKMSFQESVEFAKKATLPDGTIRPEYAHIFGK